MCRNLLAEMVRKEIEPEDIMKVIGISRRTWHNKSRGLTQFTVKEAMSIRDTYFPECSIEYLFDRAAEAV